MKKTLKVRDYERTIEKVTVIFDCERCGRQSFNVQYPGRKPKYCSECRPVVLREQARLRKRRQRARAG